MGKVVGITILVIAVAIAGVWALNAMGVLDLEQMALERLATVPAFADRVNIYRLGLSRNDAISALEAELEKERQLAEAARLQLEAEQQSLAQEWAEIERQKEELNKERLRLETEWAALYEARTIEENIARLVTLYEGMRAKDLAQVAEGLDDALMVQLLLEMEERSAATLLEALPPARAAKLSRMIAGERG